jgi:outer membrane lipoprotein-sorting protein
MRGALRLVVGIVVVAGAAGADNPDAAKQLIDKALAAHGGRDKLLQPRGYTFTVTTSVSSVAPDAETAKHFFLPPRMLRVENELRKDGRSQKSVRVVNGDKVWVARDGVVRDQPGRGSEAEDFVVTSFGFKHILNVADWAYTAEPLGPSKLGDKAVEGLKLSRGGPGGLTFELRLYFDAKTHLLVWSEQIPGTGTKRPAVPNAPRDQGVTFEDYRVVDGVAVPHRVIRRRRMETTTRVYSDFKFVDKLDPKLFEKP